MAVENEGFYSTGILARVGRIDVGAGDDRLAVEAANSGFSSTGIDIQDEMTIFTDNNTDAAAGDTELSNDGRDRVDLTADNEGGIGFNFNTNNETLNEANRPEGDSPVGALRIFTGGEDDRVNVTASNSGSMVEGVFGFQEAGFSLRQFVLHTGSDDDRVQVRANNRGGTGFYVSDYVFIGTEQGDDDVNLSGREFGIEIPFFNTLIDGGENGDDRLRSNFYIPSSIHDNFEDIPVFEIEH